MGGGGERLRLGRSELYDASAAAGEENQQEDECTEGPAALATGDCACRTERADTIYSTTLCFKLTEAAPEAASEGRGSGQAAEGGQDDGDAEATG